MSFNIYRSNEGPISWELPDDFVRLHPTCKYEIRKRLAERLYGSIVKGKVENEGPCLFCKENVFTYKKAPERIVQISQVFHQELEQRSPEVLTQMEADIKVEGAKAVPLPGKGTKFKCDRNDWLNPDLTANSQVMSFKGFPDSFFSKVKLYAYANGVVGLDAAFNKKAPGALKYFAKIGFKLTKLQEKYSCIYVEKKKVMTFLNVLIKCNNFPKEELEWMQRVINVKDWRELIKDESWKKIQHNLRWSFHSQR